MNKHEIDRIDINVSGEKPPPTWVKLVGKSPDPKFCLENIRAVQRIVAQAKTVNWPNDEWWRSSLPKWFVESFNKSIDEIMANEELWDFGSWIDAMKNPGWDWWSSQLLEDRLEINLHVFEYPFSLGPLEYVARTAGCNQLEIKEP
jgi:hypothetical protein